MFNPAGRLKYYQISRFTSVAALLLLICFGNILCSFAAEKTMVRWIGVDEFQSVLHKTPVIIDLRTPREFEDGHLKGAVNIPVDDLIENRTLLDAYKDRPVLLYCRTVNRTGRALRILEGSGFKSIYALRGGYEAFKLQGR